MKMTGNTILITGGATGIGLAMAKSLYESGNEIIICGRREHRLAEAKQMLPDIHVRTCDVSVEAERISLFEWTTNHFPKLNVVINNAGIQRDVDFLHNHDDWGQLTHEIATNLEAPIHLSALFIPHLLQQEKAAIVQVSSGLGFTPMARAPIYCATKAAIHSFSLSLRHQLRDTPIEVYEIIPPAVDSELNLESRIQRGFVNTGVTAEEFVAAVTQGLAMGTLEIAYGTAERARMAARAELDEAFLRMNR